MPDNKKAPRCPYCGAEMRIEKPIFADEYDYDASLVGAKAGWCTQATCTKCWSVAPFVYGTETEKDAYEVVREKAMKRWQEPNRVLTWEEVCAACDVPEWVFLWREWNVKNAAVYIEQICPAYELNNEDVVFVSPGDKTGGRYNKAEYGKRLRCWIRKPTMNEMENTPWEDEDEQ